MTTADLASAPALEATGATPPPRAPVNVIAASLARRAGVCLGVVLVLALMTGPAGSNTATTSGFTGSWKFPRMFWFLGYGAGLFVLDLVWRHFGKALTRAARSSWSAVAQFTAERRARLATDVLIVGAGFVWVSLISPHDTWKGGVCIQVGVAFAAMELVVFLHESVSPRLARATGYGVVGLYGIVAWATGPVPKYLSDIGAVPHDKPLGRALVLACLGLEALEVVLLGLAQARKLLPARRGRGALAWAGAALVAYGWLMWTTWSLWRATSKHTVAHWLSSIHVLPHNRAGGLAIMVVGAAICAATVAWAVVDMARTAGSKAPVTGRYQFTGITRPATFAYGRAALTIASLLVAIEWPLHMNEGIQSILTTQVAIYILLALGLNVVVGFAGLLDLGYVAFWAIGAYSTAYFTGALPIHPPFLLNPFWVIPFSIVAAMLTGVLLGTPTLRLRGDYLAIVTLGFGEIIEIVANNLDGVTGGPAGTPGFIPQFSVHIFGVKYAWTGTVLPYYYLILGVAVLFSVGFRFLEQSRVGRAWTAIREDEIAADSLGINALKYKVMAFAIGASTAGFAGVFFASQVQSLVPADFLVQTSILILVFVIFGGMGSIPGAVIGAFIIQWLPNYLQVRSFPDYVPQDEFIYLGAALVVLMIFRPQGIIPSRRRRREILLTEEGVSPPASPGGPVQPPAVAGLVPASYGNTSLDQPGYVGEGTE